MLLIKNREFLMKRLVKLFLAVYALFAIGMLSVALVACSNGNDGLENVTFTKVNS